MKLSEAYKIVKNAMRMNTPVMLWGPPGIGKSSLIHQISDELNLQPLDLRLAQLEPTDLRGVPMPNRDTNRADWFLPQFWPERAATETTREVVHVDEDGNETVENVKVPAGCCPTGPGVVFLDEIEKAPVSVKNASLQLVLDRMVGTYKLPDDWSIVAAGNREEDGAFSAPLGSALSNRMIHLDIEPDVESWATWARDNDVCDDVIGFLHFRQDLLYQQTDDHAFPSPRSWVIASNLIKSVKAQKDQKELLTASVGKGPSSEFVVWSNVYRNVDPEAIFSGQMPEPWESKEQSFKYAVALAVAFALRKRKNGIKKAEDHIANFLGILSPELRVIFLKQQNLRCLEAMSKSPAFKSRVKEIMKIVI
jgi:hypothetical protein